MSIRNISLLFLALLVIVAIAAARYFFMGETDNRNREVKFIGDILPPGNAVRSEVAENSFGAWSRKLPLKPPSSRIRLYNGKRKFFQFGLYRVIDLDIGDKDLQQCADAAIRLRADYLLSCGRIDDIAFNFTSGDRAKYSDWIKGFRPIIKDDNVSWSKTGVTDSSFAGYQDYLNTVFTYAGSYSLSHELRKVADLNKIKAGDCFIIGGFPGHVITAVDIAIDQKSGQKFAMFAQGFTPAQDIHIIRNPQDSELNPWFEISGEGQLITSEYTFDWTDLYSFE